MSTPPPEEPRDPLLDLALEIAEAKDVDWDAARTRTAAPDDTIERLRQLERVVRLAQPEPEPAPPLFHWGTLRVLEKLGEGTFGEVFRAYDPALDREVALKLRREGAPGSPTRLIEEARRLARVRHPHVLAVHGADVHDDRAGLWADLVQGRTLEDLLRTHGPLGPEEVRVVGLQLCSALAAVHAAGLVHGDVKTRNILREGAPGHAQGAGRIVLMDFGAAHLGSGRSEASGVTPLYAAPELFGDARSSIASDVYALGVVLYRMLTGEFPIEADDADALRERHAQGHFTPLRARRGDVPADLVRAIERALASRPEQRHANAAAFERALDAAHEPARVAAPASSARVWLGVAAGAALVGIAWGASVLAPRWLAPRFTTAPSRPAVTAESQIVLQSGDLKEGIGARQTRLGDIDGDGREELAISPPPAMNGRGWLRIVSVRRDGSLEPRTTIDGPDPGGQFGFAVVTGDLDGDGRDELIVSAPFASGGAENSGKVYIYHGGPGGLAAPWRVLAGDRPNQDFGYSLSAHGDVDGDGHVDLAVGAPLDDHSGHNSGAVLLYRGGPAMGTTPFARIGAPTHTPGQFGISVEDGADIDGDGVSDLIVGANFDPSDGMSAGRVYLYRGRAHFEDTPDFVIHSGTPGAWLGGAVSAPGDLDGDHEPDLLIASEYGDGFEPGAGNLQIFRGGTAFTGRPWRTLRGERSNDSFGRNFAVADVDGDGKLDVIVAAYHRRGAENGAGGVYVYPGATLAEMKPSMIFAGRMLFEHFGGGLVAMPAHGSEFESRLYVGSEISRAENGAQGGRITLLRLRRYVLMQPRANVTRVHGERLALTWRGAEPARIDASTDGGATWSTVAARAGGAAENRIEVAVPAAPASEVCWRIVPLDPKIAGTIRTQTVAIAR